MLLGRPNVRMAAWARPAIGKSEAGPPATTNRTSCSFGSYCVMSVSHLYGISLPSRSISTLLTVTLPPVSSVMLSACQYVAKPLVRWWAASQDARDWFEDGTPGWEAA